MRKPRSTVKIPILYGGCGLLGISFFFTEPYSFITYMVGLLTVLGTALSMMSKGEKEEST